MTDFGGQSVQIVTVADSGSVGYLGLKAESRTATTVANCRFRPTASSETPDGTTDVATGMWKLTAPPVAAAVAATSTSEVVYGGNTYVVVGPPQPKYDMAGTLHHVTILCRRQAG